MGSGLLWSFPLARVFRVSLERASRAVWSDLVRAGLACKGVWGLSLARACRVPFARTFGAALARKGVTGSFSLARKGVQGFFVSLARAFGYVGSFARESVQDWVTFSHSHGLWDSGILERGRSLAIGIAYPPGSRVFCSAEAPWSRFSAMRTAADSVFGIVFSACI